MWKSVDVAFGPLTFDPLAGEWQRGHFNSKMNIRNVRNVPFVVLVPEVLADASAKQNNNIFAFMA